MKLDNMRLLVVVCVASLLGLFNNCSSDMVFSDTGSLSKTLSDIIDEEDIDDIIQNCNDARAKGQLQVLEQNISFADTKIESGRSQVCEFKPELNSDKVVVEDTPGANGNYTMKNSYMRARYEQSALVQLPQGAIVCSADIDSAEQQFVYDDMIYLMMNNRVLATSIKESLAKTESEYFSGADLTLFEYDWAAVANTNFHNAHTNGDDYCAGAEEGYSQCSWPQTEQTGKIQLSYSPEVLVPISSANNLQEFKFVVTGDDDPNSDCYHAEFDLDVSLSYYVPN